MADWGETWNKVAETACGAQEAARSYQQISEDPARSEDERVQAKNEYKQATKHLYDALRQAKVQEYDGLWNEVPQAAQHAQAAAHPFSSLKHDLERSESERIEVKEAYAKAKNQLAALLVELKIVPPPEAAVPEEGKKESEVAKTPGEISEPAVSEEGPEEPREPSPPSCGTGSTP